MKSAVLLGKLCQLENRCSVLLLFFVYFLLFNFILWFFVCVVTIKYDDWVWDDECAYHFEDDKSFSEA